ncbi:MAG: PQQ-binding-like beta-propeller repeat protein [Candidatus Hydrogenedentes bacterium]|nr:PQQ-binding-like beta-propeller repeat protein [Candidatus Hydrogenedentota bacterium]
MKKPNLLISSLLATLALMLCMSSAWAQYGARGGEWTAYSGDKGSTKYSALNLIHADNVGDLQILWKWASPDNEVEAGAPPGNKITPLFVNGVLYMNSMYQIVSAIDVDTGETLWQYDPEVWKGRRPGNLGFNARGLAYWSDGKGDDRIILATQHNYMYALDAKTGELIEGFGNGGVVDLNADYRRTVNRDYVWAISPPIVANDTIIVGRAINDVPTIKEMPPGDVFAYDARTGEHKWTFHNPPRKGEPGYETWMEGAGEYTGNANVWTHMSADENLGLVYLPFGTPTNDWYGGHRKGDNLYAESLVAVDIETGKRVWHFQHVHHGLWDYDIPTAPALIDISVDGKPIQALAQITKQGFIWVLDRETGEPVWPIEERPVPQSNVPGEASSPTQPFPTKPAPYDEQGATEDMLIDYTPELKAEALKILEEYNSGPLYTPAMVEKRTIFNPGWGGGGNWSGVSVDPHTGIVYIPSLSGAAISVSLTKPDAARSNFDYVVQHHGQIEGPQGLPLFKGPYARVTAIDLNTGNHIWRTAIGDGPIDHPALKDLNLPPLGDHARGFPLLTKSLLFIASGGGGTNFRALDKATGNVIFEMDLPGAPSGTPMTYTHDGKQYIAVPVVLGRRGPAELLVLGLPEE